MKKSFYKPTIFLAFSFALVLFSSCKKSSDLPAAALGTPEKPSQKMKLSKVNADVATVWYRLQLRIILNAIPAYSNTATVRVFAYTGVALYESVQPGLSHSHSLSNSLNGMPAMP